MNWLCTLLTIGCTSVSGAARIIDGDTLVISSVHVRLAGIDAEELFEPNGPLARNQLVRLTEGFTVSCTLGAWSYNRRIGVCRAQGLPLGVAEPGQLTLNAAMVASGAALDCARYSGGMYRHLEPAGARDRLRQKPYC
jgi:endonuclease YncB( thermonuclease family)